MTFPIIDSWTSVQTDIIDRFVLKKRGGNSQEQLTEASRKHLYAEINGKLKSPLYQNLDANSIINTIKYVYWETRAGIFVSIRNNKLEAFLPFANAKYRNDWSKELSFFGVPKGSKQPVKDYLLHKKKVLGYSRRMMMNPQYWWANHHFLNVESRPDVWGQHSLQEYFEMISEALKQHQVSNIMFVINKRDHPILRADLRKPYTFLYRNGAPPLTNPASSYAPIVTSYSNPEYLDITIPIVQDWIIATKPEEYYPITEDVPWSDKIETAFFRGAATGRLNNNQRIRLAKVSSEWSTKHTNAGSPLLDAGLTSWNLSDKIDSGGFVHYIIPKEMEAMGITLKKKIPMNEQVCYKYLINIDGHTAPNRTSWILNSGCLMLLVESLYQDHTWTDNNLKPWKHYVPIKADLSDLEEQLLWCKSHDDECKQIVRQAKAFARLYFNRDTIAEYMAYMLNRMAANAIKA
jgi:hypothetical protein